MKISVNWLKELVDIDLPVDELAHKLTMSGLEVEEISPVAAPFDRIVIAEVKSVTPHPNADKLRVCEVDAGTGVNLQIVCGAPNVEVGMRVPCALVGAKLPGLEIKQAKLRGAESNGMLCSARELGLSEDHGGLLALAADAPIGQDVRTYLELDDVYLTLKLTPNRGDCLSMLGIARDLAAMTEANLKIPSIAAIPSTGEDSRAISLSAGKACGRYVGRVIANINAKAQTPDWMKRRLERSGFRTIAPLVDITNYITLECGRPMHAFDNDKLCGNINVRFAKSGEEMNLLIEQHVVLQPDMLLITDDSGPVAMGGVMGGLESMCTADTKNVFFEAAYFDPAAIQGKTKLLGINSDAAFRFERGVDPENARDGIEYATELTLAICGTSNTTVGPVVEAVAELPARSAVIVRPTRVNRLIGMPIAVDDMVRILRSLQCNVVEANAVLKVIPPSYRFDLNIEEDFVEEIARGYGYDKLPAKPPVSSLPMMPIPEAIRSRSAMRHVMADLGYQEVINYSFTPEEWEADFAANLTPLKLMNPIASQMSAMRSNLVGGLIDSLQHNLNHGEARLKLFEIGRCFLSDKADVSNQPEKLGGIAYGARYPEQWGEGGQKGAQVDFFSVKGELESLMHGIDVGFERNAHPALHPGRSARVVCQGATIGFLGELHPKWTLKYDLPLAPVLFELDVAALSRVGGPTYRPFSRMQAVRRDIALLVNEAIEIQSMINAVISRKPAFVAEFSVFDIFHGKNLEAGKKSVALRIVMQDTARTLTDSEVDNKVAEIVEVLSQEYGATLRK